jgi:RNA polymerase sigma factor FliA
MKTLEISYNEGTQKTKVSHKSRNQLIEEYAPLINYIAQRMRRKLPRHIELDDLINSGVLGLIDAIEKFNPLKNIQFKTYAEIRIRGAILDGLRAQDWVPRSLRQKANKMASTYVQVEQKLGRPASMEDIADELKVEVEEVANILTQLESVPLISLEEIMPDPQEEIKESLSQQLLGLRGGDALSLLNLEQIKKAIGQAIEQLPPKEKMVVTLYYYEELTMKEIGKVLNITQSRISQLHTQAILRLKGKLKKFLAD